MSVQPGVSIRRLQRFGLICSHVRFSLRKAPCRQCVSVCSPPDSSGGDCQNLFHSNVVSTILALTAKQPLQTPQTKGHVSTNIQAATWNMPGTLTVISRGKRTDADWSSILKGSGTAGGDQMGAGYTAGCVATGSGVWDSVIQFWQRGHRVTLPSSPIGN